MQSMVFEGFALLGSEGDETRLLVHEVSGYAGAVPGTPTAAAGRAMPSSHVVVTLADLPVQIAYRMDQLDGNTVEPEPLAIALLLAYADTRAASPPRGAQVRGKQLPAGAAAGATATYVLRGDDPRAIESVTVVVRPTSEATFALFRVSQFRTGETNPLQWLNLRTAIDHGQDWTGPSTIVRSSLNAVGITG